MAILIPDLFHGDASGRPDWSALARNDRFYGAILKATEGTDYPAGATWFRDNWPRLRDAGAERYGATWFRGCYHYLQVGDDPVAQAEYYLSAVQAAGGWGPGDIVPIVDVERGQKGGGNFTASARQVIDCTSKWVETVKANLPSATSVILYARGVMVDLGIADSMSCDYLWDPRYAAERGSTAAVGWSDDRVMLWQYTDGRSNFTQHPSSVPGIGHCDINLFLGGDVNAFIQALLLGDG